ncbi:hypothetical protein [Vampirovibrio sp.]|uniref:hypothetical protein n=1 Tax=Vampirovibrio sp. TaxID=2717857 RepID=UPI003592E8BC
MENRVRMWVSCEKNIISTALCGLLLGSLLLPQAQAEKRLQSPNEPIDIKLNQTLSSQQSKVGDAFEGALTDTYRLGEKELPVGTLVKGSVQGGHGSRIMGMPGYVALDIQEAVLPSGAVYHFEKDGESLKTKKYHNPKAGTGKNFVMAAIPFSAISALDAVPLKYAAGMSFWQIAPISLAARMALGVGLESSQKYRTLKGTHHRRSTRIGYGMLRGTGLTGAYRMVTTGPEPDLKEGTVISVHLPKKHMQKLFEAGDSVKTVDATESTPVNTEALEPAETETQSFETVRGTLPSTLSKNAADQTVTPPTDITEHPPIEPQPLKN